MAARSCCQAEANAKNGDGCQHRDQQALRIVMIVNTKVSIEGSNGW
jgi:hypothetical protein